MLELLHNVCHGQIKKRGDLAGGFHEPYDAGLHGRGSLLADSLFVAAHDHGPLSFSITSKGYASWLGAIEAPIIGQSERRKEAVHLPPAEQRHWRQCHLPSRGLAG